MGGWAKSGLVVLRGRATFLAPKRQITFSSMNFPCAGQSVSGWVPLELSPPPPVGVGQVLWVPALLILPPPPPPPSVDLHSRKGKGRDASGDQPIGAAGVMPNPLGKALGRPNVVFCLRGGAAGQAPVEGCMARGRGGSWCSRAWGLLAIPRPRPMSFDGAQALPHCHRTHWPLHPLVPCGPYLQHARGGRPVRILDPNRVRKLLGVWRGGKGGGGGARWVGRSAARLPSGGRWVTQHRYLKMTP